MVELQGQPDPNAGPYTDKSQTYRVIVMDAPQMLHLRHRADSDRYSSKEVMMICIGLADGLDAYEGRHITFSIDLASTRWPSEWAVPVGQPFTGDIHVLE